jgi:hypothetical protein
MKTLLIVPVRAGAPVAATSPVVPAAAAGVCA